MLLNSVNSIQQFSNKELIQSQINILKSHKKIGNEQIKDEDEFQSLLKQYVNSQSDNFDTKQLHQQINQLRTLGFKGRPKQNEMSIQQQQYLTGQINQNQNYLQINHNDVLNQIQQQFLDTQLIQQQGTHQAIKQFNLISSKNSSITKIKRQSLSASFQQPVIFDQTIKHLDKTFVEMSEKKKSQEQIQDLNQNSINEQSDSFSRNKISQLDIQTPQKAQILNKQFLNTNSQDIKQEPNYSESKTMIKNINESFQKSKESYKIKEKDILSKSIEEYNRLQIAKQQLSQESFIHEDQRKLLNHQSFTHQFSMQKFNNQIAQFDQQLLQKSRNFNENSNQITLNGNKFIDYKNEYYIQNFKNQHVKNVEQQLFWQINNQNIQMMRKNIIQQHSSSFGDILIKRKKAKERIEQKMEQSLSQLSKKLGLNTVSNKKFASRIEYLTRSAQNTSNNLGEVISNLHNNNILDSSFKSLSNRDKNRNRLRGLVQKSNHSKDKIIVVQQSSSKNNLQNFKKQNKILKNEIVQDISKSLPNSNQSSQNDLLQSYLTTKQILIPKIQKTQSILKINLDIDHIKENKKDKRKFKNQNTQIAKIDYVKNEKKKTQLIDNQQETSLINSSISNKFRMSKMKQSPQNENEVDKIFELDIGNFQQSTELDKIILESEEKYTHQEKQSEKTITKINHVQFNSKKTSFEEQIKKDEQVQYFRQISKSQLNNLQQTSMSSLMEGIIKEQKDKIQNEILYRSDENFYMNESKIKLQIDSPKHQKEQQPYSPQNPFNQNQKIKQQKVNQLINLKKINTNALNDNKINEGIVGSKIDINYSLQSNKVKIKTQNKDQEISKYLNNSAGANQSSLKVFKGGKILKQANQQLKQEYLKSPEIFTQNRIKSQLSSMIVQPERNLKLKTVYKTRDTASLIENKQIVEIKLQDKEIKTDSRIDQNVNNLYEFIVQQKYNEQMHTQQLRSSSSSGNDENIDDSQIGKDYPVQENNYSDTNSSNQKSKECSVTRKSHSNQKKKIDVQKKKLRLIDANSSLVIVNMNKNNLMKIEESKELPPQKQEEKNKIIKVNDQNPRQSKLHKRQILKINKKVIQLFENDKQNIDKKGNSSFNVSPLNTVSHFINETKNEKIVLDVGLENVKNNYSMKGKKYPENREKFIKYQMRISQQNEFNTIQKNQQSNYFQYVENPYEKQQKRNQIKHQSVQFTEDKQIDKSRLNIQELNHKMINKKLNESYEIDNSVSYQDNIFLQNQYNNENSKARKIRSPMIDSPTPQTHLNINDEQYQFNDIKDDLSSQKFRQNQRQVVALKDKEIKKNIQIKDEKIFNNYNEMNSHNATLFLKKKIDFQEIQEENIKQSQQNEDNDFLDRQISNQSDKLDQNMANHQLQQSTSDKNFSSNHKETLIDQQRIFDENLSKSFKFKLPINNKLINNSFLPQIIPQSNLQFVQQNKASKNSIQFMTENTELSQLTFYKQMQAKRMQTISPISGEKYKAQPKTTAFPQIQNISHSKQGLINQAVQQLRNKYVDQIIKSSDNKMSPSNYILETDRNQFVHKFPKIKKAKLESLIGSSTPFPTQYLQQNTFIVQSFQKMQKQNMKKEQSTQSLDSRESLQNFHQQTQISKENFIFQKDKKHIDTQNNFWENKNNQQPFYQIQSQLQNNDLIYLSQDTGRNNMVYNNSSLNSNEFKKQNETSNKFKFKKKDTLSLIFKNNIYSVHNSSNSGRISLHSNQKLRNSQSKLSKSEQRLIQNISVQNMSFKQNIRYNNQDLEEFQENQNEFENQDDQ